MVDHAKFERLHVQVLGIGPSNPFSQKTFADSLKLSYPLLSDHPDLKVIQQYGVLKYEGEAKTPVAQGSYFLIDKQGILRGIWMHPAGQDVFPSDPFLEMAQQLEQQS
jgi:peroxiredoxin